MVGKEIVPLSINPSDPLGEIASCSHVLNFCWPGNVGSFLMVWSQAVLLTGDITKILLSWKLRLLSGHFWIQVSLSQQAKKKNNSVKTGNLPRGNWIASPK